MFERLLLAIDDSPASEVATSFAAAFAQRVGASVHVFHVNEYQVGCGGLALRTRDEATELLTDAVEQLREVGVRAGGSAMVASHRRVPRCIAEAAQVRDAGAIVLGSRRHGRLERIFAPHVRAKTTRLSALPILIAPAPLEISAHGARRLDEVITQQIQNELLVLPR